MLGDRDSRDEAEIVEEGQQSWSNTGDKKRRTHRVMSPLDFMLYCPPMRNGKLYTWEKNDGKNDSQTGLQRWLSH